MYRHLYKCLYKGLCPKLSTNQLITINVYFSSYKYIQFNHPGKNCTFYVIGCAPK